MKLICFHCLVTFLTNVCRIVCIKEVKHNFVYLIDLLSAEIEGATRYKSRCVGACALLASVVMLFDAEGTKPKESVVLSFCYV